MLVPALDRPEYEVLSGVIIDRALDHFVLDLPWDDDHAVKVAEIEIAGVDLGSADLGGHAVVDDPGADGGVLRVPAAAEHRPRGGVGVEAADDRAAGAGRSGADLPP